MMKNSVFLFIFLFTFNLFAQEQALIILHTNDHHGHYNSFDHGVGGLSAQKTFVDQIRKQAEEKKQYVLLLSGGDINTGTFESDLQKAEPDFKGMSMIGYDAMAVGNHEWDNPLQVIQAQQQWSNFPFLSANTRFRSSQKHVFQPHTVICLPKHQPSCDLKVGIFGLTTPETSHLVSPEVLKDISFTDPIKEAKKSIRELKKQKVDLIVAVTHMGHDGPERDHKGKIQYRDVMIARAVSGIDVIVGGHTQVALPKPLEEKETLILQAQEWGKHVGKLQMSFKKNHGRYQRQKSYQYELVSINPVSKIKENGKEEYKLPPSVVAISEDPSLLAFFVPFNQKADQLGNAIVGQLSKQLDGTRNLVRSQPMPIGLWIAQIFQKEAKSDFAMMNSGGIRSSLKEGQVTKRDLHAIHPFGNTLIYVPLSPEKVLNYVTYGFKSMLAAREELLHKVPDLQGAYPHWSGLQIKVKNDQIQEIVSSDANNPWRIEVQNEKVVSSTKKQYLFSTINFIGKGGDGYPVLNQEKEYIDTGLTVDHLMIKYFTDQKKDQIPELEKKLETSPSFIQL
jgi:5'-nucleotidase/UDP-sugar diphosphatase